MATLSLLRLSAKAWTRTAHMIPARKCAEPTPVGTAHRHRRQQPQQTRSTAKLNHLGVALQEQQPLFVWPLRPPKGFVGYSEPPCQPSASPRSVDAGIQELLRMKWILGLLVSSVSVNLTLPDHACARRRPVLRRRSREPSFVIPYTGSWMP